MELLTFGALQNRKFDLKVAFTVFAAANSCQPGKHPFSLGDMLYFFGVFSQTAKLAFLTEIERFLRTVVNEEKLGRQHEANAPWIQNYSKMLLKRTFHDLGFFHREIVNMMLSIRPQLREELGLEGNTHPNAYFMKIYELLQAAQEEQERAIQEELALAAAAEPKKRPRQEDEKQQQ